MKTVNKLKSESCSLRFTFSLVKSAFLSAVLLSGIQTASAQETPSYSRPSWRFGVAGAANLNFYDGTTQQLTSDLTIPTAFHKGFGVGPYAGALAEFHKPGTLFGFMIQAGYDNRDAHFKQITTPCNCPADLKTRLRYLSLEPSLRIAPFKSDFYLFAGPRFAYNYEKLFTYQLHVNPAFPDQTPSPEIKGELSDVNDLLISMQVGAGYDFQLSDATRRTQFIASPFVSFHPYFGQAPRSIESWNVTTVRAGVALKIGSGRSANTAEPVSETAADIAPLPEITFYIHAPKNIPQQRRVRETFPIRNYVFFDLGSTAIPERYVTLEKSQVKEFKEDQLEVFQPKELSGRANRQMIAYYNILNILGDRMGKNPSSTVNLAGSSEQGLADGKAMAESVKSYLVNVFGIDGSRITTVGEHKPKIPSEVVDGTRELELLSECNRRVTIQSNSTALLMEFQSGPDAPLKPVEIIDLQEAPLDSYVTFHVDGAKVFKSWTVTMKDSEGIVQNFGPYTGEKISLPGKSILGNRAKGDFTATMTGTSKNGKTMTKEEQVHIVLWTPAEDEEGMRYSVIFEFNESTVGTVYEKYLTEIVAKKITTGSTVIIHGYTDVIGNAEHNLQLSHARATDVKEVLTSSLQKMGISGIKFELYAFGEDENLSPFRNDYPEERFYNRTVVVDIIPQ